MLGEDALQDAGLFTSKRVTALVRKWHSGKLTGARDNMAFIGLLSTQLLARQFGPELETRIADSALLPDEIDWRGAAADNR